MGNPVAIETFLSLDADIKIKITDSATARHPTIEKHEYISVVLNKGAIVDVTDSSSRPAAHYLIMLADDADPDNLNESQKLQVQPSPSKETREALGNTTRLFS